MSHTINIYKTSLSDFARWQRIYDKLPEKGIYHSPKYIKFLEKHYGDEAELFYWSDGDQFVYYPYFKRCLEMLPYANECPINLSKYYDIIVSWYYGGPLIGCLEAGRDSLKKFSSSFSEYAKDMNIVSEFIRYDPNLQNQRFFEGALPLELNRQSLNVELSASEEDIWKNMEGRARTAIRKALNYDVEIIISNAPYFVDQFIEIYDLEMQRKKAPAHYLFPKDFYNELFSKLKDNTQLICAQIDGKVVSGGIFVYDNIFASHYYLMATLHDYFRYQTNSLIINSAISHFKKLGVRLFDLQGGRSGVYKFKKSFSKRSVPFYTSKIIHCEDIYNRLTTFCRNKFKICQDDYFPGYRVKDTN